MEPTQDIATGVMSSLVDAVGVKGVIVLITLASLWLLKHKSVRRIAGKVIAKAGKQLLRYVKLTMWASRMRIGLRLAHRLQRKQWAGMCEDRQLVGLRRGKIKRTNQGVDVLCTLNGRLTVEYVQGKVSALETGLGIRRGAVRIVEGATANRIIVRLSVRDPLPKVITWEPAARQVSITDPCRLAPNSFGEWTEIDLCQRILIVGASGSGKSSVQRVLSARVLEAVDADLEVWDLKSGTESQHYEGKAVHRVISTEQCAERIGYLLGTMIEQRSAEMKRLGTSTWPTSPTHPVRIVMIDEGAKAVRELEPDTLKQLFTIMEQARAYGVYIWWATQMPKATNLPTELRSQFSCIIALLMRKASESRVIFEDDTKEGWLPNRLPGKGWCLIQDEDHTEPEQYKLPFIHEDKFKALKPCPTRPVDMHTVQPKPAPEPEPFMEPRERIIRALETAGDGGGAAKAIGEVTKLSKSEVYRQLNELRQSGHVEQVKQGRWALVLEGAKS